MQVKTVCHKKIAIRISTKHFSDVSHNAINRTGQESGTAASNFEPAIRTVVK